MATEWGRVGRSVSSRGTLTYSIELWHRELGRHRVIKSNELAVLQRKAELQANEWDTRWAAESAKRADQVFQQQKRDRIAARKTEASERTLAATQALDVTRSLLHHTLDIDDAIDWDTLLSMDTFAEPGPEDPNTPDPPTPLVLLPGPQEGDTAFQPRLGLLGMLFASKRAIKEAAARDRFAAAHEEWVQDCGRRRGRHVAAVAAYEGELHSNARIHAENLLAWEEQREAFIVEQQANNEAILRKRDLHSAGDPDAVVEYCDMVLSNSEYPDWIPQEWDFDYLPQSRTLVVDYLLPGLENLPTLMDVKYVQSRDEFTEKHMSPAQKNQLYDGVVYQIAIRTVHELFEADTIGALESIVFNGRLTWTDKGTGHEVNACILSVQTTTAEFGQLNPEKVEPKACFHTLKGVGSTRIHSLTPIAPIVQMTREDARFVEKKAITATLDSAEPAR